MRTPNRTRQASRRNNNRGCVNNKGCAVVVVIGVILMILVVSLLFRGCTSRVSNMLKGAEDTIATQQYPIKYQSLVERYSKKFDLDKYLVYAVIRTESRFDQYAVSGAGAYGLMQLQEETANDCAKKLDLDITLPDDLHVPDTNIHIGTYYLSWLLEKYDGNIDLAIAAYNGGIGNVDKWLKDDRYRDGQGGLADIPFPETKGYVQGVNHSYKKYVELYE